MRVLVVGAGRMGAIRVEDLVTDPRVTQVLVTNRDGRRADALAEQTGARAVPWEGAAETLAHGTADAVVIAVGTDAHEPLLHAVLPHGRPVLCEKPIALSLGATEAVIALAREHGTALQVGFQRRFDPAIRAIREHIAAGGLGTLYSMTVTAHDHLPSERAFIAGSGGIFRDLHVHDFDLVQWLAGSVIETVYATKAVREHRDYADFDDADVSAIAATTTDGVQIVITGTRHDALGHDVRLEVFGSGDSVSAGLTTRTPLRTMEADPALAIDPYRGFVDRFREAFRQETQAFVSLALGETGNPCPPDSALTALRTAIACERSVATGAAVRVADVTDVS